MITKKCCKCKQNKNIFEFGKDNSKQDLLTVTCKSCQKEYRDCRKKEKLQYDREYRIKNKEKIQNYDSFRYYKNHEKNLNDRKQYRFDNKNILKEKKKCTILKNKKNYK